MNEVLVVLSDLTVSFMLLTQILLLGGVAVLIYIGMHFKVHLDKQRSGKGLMENEETKKWSANIRTKLINSIENGKYEDMSYLDELQELTNFDGAVPTLSVIEVNIVELIMSYRREILHETHLGVSVSIQTAMSPQSRAILDTVVFRQLMMNLLRISAKRTHAGRITIDYEWERDGLRFKVRDSGTPLSADVYPQLFSDSLNEEMIPNLDKKVTVTKLKLCKMIVEAWQGTIEAQPGENNMGLVFSFWIPCKIRVN